MQLQDAKRLAQEAWDLFRHLPPDSVEIRLLTAFIQELGDCRENVEEEKTVEKVTVESTIQRIQSAPTMAEIDAAIGAVCSIGGG